MVKSTQNLPSLEWKGVNPHHDCHRACERDSWTSVTEALCKHKCDLFVRSPSHSQTPTLSEKLAASANNLLDESLKLSSMADEIHAQDPMYL
ncbi:MULTISPECIES: hypothetical protein [unclassified Wolbachia]|uniref:hypothetical protein n=1 Tax=unclassified Wolbachia TaxID=2640676 RepID=UPI00222642ED|nr:hypothetical protein [Wolbachia endosymbiont (group A) of Rhinocyllus conicus]